MIRFTLIFVMSLAVSSQALAVKWNNPKSENSSNSTSTKNTSIFGNINESTSRHLRTKYMCKVATKERMKPLLRGKDNFLMSNEMFVYADLYGDGSLELITGNYDEAYENKGLEGNDIRSRQPHQYMFFSPNPDFKTPDNTKFIMARTMFVQDFNGDGIDDVVFVQHGPDYQPYEKQNNKILLSGDEGYTVQKLPGPTALHHGGSAGDIDRDGDVDIVITPGDQNKVIYLINDGKGKFSYKVFLGKNQSWKQTKRYYNSLLWDLDGDGFLDLVLDGGLDNSGEKDLPPVIHWGKKGNAFSSPFEKKPTILEPSIYGNLMQDAVVADINNDDKDELIFLNSDPLNEKDIRNNYKGFSFSAYKFSGRNVSKPETLASYTSVNSYYLWLARFAECDIGKDGDIDFVFESHGERYWAFGGYVNPDTHHWGVDKLLWLNNGKGLFTLKKAFDPQYWHPNEKTNIENGANTLGVTVSKYSQSKVYYPLNNSATYFDRTIGFFIPDNQRNFSDLPPLSNENLAKSKATKPASVVDNSRPEYMIKMDKLCSKAIVDSEWNNLAPGWVEVAKSRGFTVDMCKKALTPIETIRANNKPKNDYLIKLNKLCSDAISGDDWSKINLGSVAVAKDRGLSVQMCKMAIEKCRDTDCYAE